MSSTVTVTKAVASSGGGAANATIAVRHNVVTTNSAINKFLIFTSSFFWLKTQYHIHLPCSVEMTRPGCSIFLTFFRPNRFLCFLAMCSMYGDVFRKQKDARADFIIEDINESSLSVE
jgi:hypothetical protein